MSEKMYVIEGNWYSEESIEKLRKGTDGNPSRIIPIKLLDNHTGPSYGSDFCEGYAFVEKNGAWYYVNDYINGYLGRKSFSFRLPDDFFCGMTLEKFREAINSVVESQRKESDIVWIPYDSDLKKDQCDVKALCSLFR